MASTQSYFCTKMNPSSQKTSAIPAVNMWTSRLPQHSPSNFWLYANSLFARKHHLSVDLDTGIYFCILKPSAWGETIAETFTDWALNTYWFLSLFLSAAVLFHFPPLLVPVIYYNFSFPLFSDHHLSSPTVPVFIPWPAHSLCFVIPTGLNFSSLSNSGMERYGGEQRGGSTSVNIDLG